MRSLARLTRSLKKLSLLDEQNVKGHVVTCDVGLTCDIIDELLSMPIIVSPANLVVLVLLMMPH